MSGSGPETGGDDRRGPNAVLRGAWRSGALRLTLAAVAATATAAAPVFLLGSVAVEVQRDLGIGRTRIGLAIAAFYVASVLTGPFVVTRLQRLGMRAGVRLTALFVGAGLLLVAGAARSYWMLVVAMAVAGIGQAFGQPSANGLLVRGLRPGRQGLAFGIKQVGIPLPALLAGAALPVVALTVGWRWVFAGAAVLMLCAPLLVPPRLPAGRPAPRDAGVPAVDPATVKPLRRLAVGGVFASVAVISYGAFLVDTVVTAGISQSVGGALLAYGSILSIVVRLVLGWLVDRRDLDPVRTMVPMMLAGAVGTAALGFVSELWVIVIIVTVVWGIGWSWNPLIDLAVVRVGRNAPAAASGVVVTAFYAGAAIGPFAVGAVADAFGYGAAWLLAAVCLAISALLFRSVGAAPR